MENGVARRESLAGGGAVLDRTILGDCLLVKPGEVGDKRDRNRVRYFDLPLRPSGAVSRR